MMELLLGLALSTAGFVAIMAVCIIGGRTIGWLFGPREDR